jgi:Ca2+-binding RTX toxin-like protein
MIGAGGSINANNSGISQGADGSSNIFVLNNAGAINGASGVVVTGLAALVVNTGNIQGYLGSGIELSGFSPSFDTTLDNSGLIRGRSIGVTSSGTATERLTNTEGGVIAGSIAAMSLSNAVSLVVNRGLMDGNVSLAGGADRFDGSFGQQGAVYGGLDNDTVWGGAGDDSLFGDEGADRLRSGAGDDALYGGAEADLLAAAAGDDFLAGGDGDDSLIGGADDDDLSGDLGLDRLLGGQGDDTIRGGGDVDTLIGGLGDDVLTGGAGGDTFVFYRGQGTDRITDFANNADKIDLRAFDFDNFAQLRALASASSLGVRIDLPGEGMLYLGVLSLANFDASDVLI